MVLYEGCWTLLLLVYMLVGHIPFFRCGRGASLTFITECIVVTRLYRNVQLGLRAFAGFSFLCSIYLDVSEAIQSLPTLYAQTMAAGISVGAAAGSAVAADVSVGASSVGGASAVVVSVGASAGVVSAGGASATVVSAGAASEVEDEAVASAGGASATEDTAGGASSAGGASAGGGGGAPASSSGGAGTKLKKKLAQFLGDTKAKNSRSSIQPNLPRRTTHNIRSIRTTLRLLTQFRIISYQLRTRRIHNHHLSLLAMRPRRTVQIHWLRARDGHVEGSNIGLSVLERDVARVYAFVHGSAGCVRRGLSDGVVAVGELELHDVAYGCGDGIRDEGVLGTTDYDWDYLVGAAEGVCCEVLVRRRCWWLGRERRLTLDAGETTKGLERRARKCRGRCG
jgi:hypothetical protein